MATMGVKRVGQEARSRATNFELTAIYNGKLIVMISKA